MFADRDEPAESEGVGLDLPRDDDESANCVRSKLGCIAGEPVNAREFAPGELEAAGLTKAGCESIGFIVW